MDFSICSDCEALTGWGPSLVIALMTVAGVVLGYAIRRIAGRFGFLVLATIVTGAGALVLGAQSWREARTWHAALPFAGVLVGLLHRRHAYLSVFGRRD